MDKENEQIPVPETAEMFRLLVNSIDRLREVDSPQSQAVNDVVNLKRMAILFSREKGSVYKTDRPSRYDRVAATLGAYNAICIEKASCLGKEYADTFEKLDNLIEERAATEFKGLPKIRGQFLNESKSYRTVMSTTLDILDIVLTQVGVGVNAGLDVANIVLRTSIK